VSAGSLTAAGTALGDVGRELADPLLHRMLNAASYAIKLDAVRIAGAVSGGDRRLSRYGSTRSRGRVRLGVGYDINGARSVINLRPAALWVLANGGARPHPIGVGRRTRTGSIAGRQRRGEGRRLLVIDGKVRTAPVQHPGTAGRGAVVALYAAVPDLVADAFAGVIGWRLERGR